MAKPLIQYSDGVWWSQFPYEDFRSRDRVKGCRWSFHWGAGKCRAQCPLCKNGIRVPDKVWWTSDIRSVSNAAAEDWFELSETANAEIERTAGLRKDHHKDISHAPTPAPEGKVYTEYQKQCVAFCRTRRGVLIGDEMGLGKTIEAIACVNDDVTISNVLVVCPATLKNNWANEIRDWCARPCQIVIAETSKDVMDLPQAGLRWIIVNPERLIKERGNNLIAELHKMYFHALIVDEAHRIKNPRAATTIAVLGAKANRRKGTGLVEGLLQRCGRALFLTGTPMPNKPKELFPLVHALAPEEFGKEWDYLMRYCDGKRIDVPMRGRGVQAVWNFDGASNLGELREKLRATIMIRRLKRDVLKELPAKIRQIIPFGAEGFKDLLMREKAAFQELLELGISTREVAAKLKAKGLKFEDAIGRLNVEELDLAGSSLAAVRQQIALAKLPLVFEHVRNLREDGVKKIVIFAHHHTVLDALAKEYDGECIVMTGKTAMGERQGLVDEFQESEDKNIFIGGIRAAGVGLTLTSSHNVVFVESDFVPASITQAEDRVHRIGQKAPVLIQHLVIDGSVESLMLKVAVKKQNIADRALDGVTK